MSTRPARWPLVVLTWNAKVGRGSKVVCGNLRQLIRDNPDADVIHLQEAMNYVRRIRIAFAPLWRVYAPGGWEEAANSPVMVRRWRRPHIRREGSGWGWVRNREHWIGPKHGILHPGRTWTWVRVTGVACLSLHRVYGGQNRNAKAYQEEWHRLTAFAKGRPRVFIAGDTNTPLTANWPYDMRSLAEELGGTILAPADERGPDYAVAVGLTGSCTRLGKYGSDHHATRCELTPDA